MLEHALSEDAFAGQLKRLVVGRPIPSHLAHHERLSRVTGYMIGVFVSFTLSQAGMVAHWRRRRGRTWKTAAIVNAIGAAVTGVVLLVVATTKAHEGAWITLVLIPVHVMFFRATRRHYDLVNAQLSPVTGTRTRRPGTNIVVVPISGVHLER